MRKLFLLVILSTFISLSMKAQPEAMFSADVLEGCVSLNVQYTDLSTSANNIVNWEWDFGEGSISNLQNPLFTYDFPGIYNVCLTVTDDNDQMNMHCETAYITVFENPIADAGQDMVINCNNAFVTLDGSASTSGPGILYEWKDQNGIIISNELVIDISTAGIFMLCVTNEDGCVDTDLVNIVEDVEAPLAAIAANPSCEIPIMLNIGSSSSGPNFSYEWTAPDGEILGSGSEIEVTLLGDYTLVVTNELNGCQSSGNYLIDETSSPIEIVLEITCALPGQDNGAINATITGGAPPYDYSWSNGAASEDVTGLISGFTYWVTVSDGNDCTAVASADLNGIIESIRDTVDCLGNVPLFVEAPTGLTYNWEPASFLDDPTSDSPVATITSTTTFNVTVTNAEGCEDYASIESDVPEDIILYMEVINPICGLNNGSIAAWDICGGGPFTYDWSPNVSTTFEANDLAPGVYNLTVTDDLGLTVTRSIVLVDIGELEISVNGPDYLCTEEFMALNVSVNYPGSSAQFTYDWAGPGSYTVGGSSITNLNAQQDNTGCYSVTVTHDSGCSAVAEHCLEVFGVAEMIGDGMTFCENDQAQLEVIAPNAVSYEWSTGDLSCYDCPNPLASVGLGGETFYSVTVTDPNGCTDEDVLNFNVQSYLDFSLLEFSNSPVYEGQEIVFDCNVINPTSVTWNGPGNFTSNDCDPVISNANSGNGGNYSLDIIDQYGCTVNTTAEVFVYEIIEYISNDTLICEGESVQLEVIAPDAVSISWTPATNLNDPFIANPIAITSNSTLYTVTVEDINGTIEQASVYIEIVPAPFITAVGPLLLCLDGNSTVICAETLYPGTFLWTWPGGTGNSTEACFELLNGMPSGCYALEYTSLDGCTFFDEICVTVIDELILNPFQSDTICTQDEFELSVEAPNAVSYEWTPIENLSCSSCPNPTASPSEYTTYTVIVTDVNGCSEAGIYELVVDESCVWPGDTDDNDVVDNFDLLNIGLAFDALGPVRSNASISWVGQVAPYWNEYINTVDYRHIDCNGNGLINSDDTLAITQNWGLEHEFRSENDPQFFTSNYPQSNSVLTIPFYVDPDTLIENESYALPVILGEVDNPAEDVYGLAFSLEYDSSVVVAGSASVGFDGWIGELNNDMIAIQKTFVSPGRIDVGITRVDGLPMDGFGQMGLLFITIEDDVLLRADNDDREGDEVEVLFNITNVLVINNLGEEIPVIPMQTSTILAETVGTNDVNWGEYIQIAPNPADDKIFLISENIEIQNIKLYTVTGELLKNPDQRSSTIEIQTSDLNSGVYLLEVWTELGVMVERVVVMH